MHQKKGILEMKKSSNRSVSHNVCYATLSDYLDSRDSAFRELVYCYIQLCRRSIKLRQCCDDTDVCSEQHREFFSNLCEVAHFEGYIKYSLFRLDENFPLSLVQDEISK